MTRKTVMLLVLSCLGILLPASLAAFQAGERAPDFTLPNLQGDPVSLALRGDRPALLVIGTTWCPSCRAQTLEAHKVAGHFGPKLSIMEIFVQESEDAVRNYVDALEADPAQALIDDNTVQARYSIYLIPRVIIVDADGKIAYDGSVTRAENLTARINALLENAAPEAAD